MSINDLKDKNNIQQKITMKHRIIQRFFKSMLWNLVKQNNYFLDKSWLLCSAPEDFGGWVNQHNKRARLYVTIEIFNIFSNFIWNIKCWLNFKINLKLS